MAEQREKLFGRRVELRIDDKVFDDYDIEFVIDKELRAEPNDAKIKIYNLSESLVSELQKSAIELELSAGYPRTTTRIFKGSVRFVNPQHLGADFVVQIEAGESEAAIRSARINQTYSEGTSLEKVVKDLVATFDGVSVGNIDEIGLFQFSVKNALTLNGPSADALAQQLKSRGFGYTINQDRFVFVKLGQPTEHTAVVLDETSGLIGSPEMGEKKAAKSDKDTTAEEKPRRYMKIRSLLNGLIEPGRAIRLETDGQQGTFVCEKVIHQGSNFDNDFYTDTEAFAQS